MLSLQVLTNMMGAPLRWNPIIQEGVTKFRGGPRARNTELKTGTDGWRRGKQRCWTYFPNCRTARLVKAKPTEVAPTLKTVSLLRWVKHSWFKPDQYEPDLQQTLSEQLLKAKLRRCVVVSCMLHDVFAFWLEFWSPKWWEDKTFHHNYSLNTWTQVFWLIQIFRSFWPEFS